jgi:hypothetical protein
LILPPEIGDIEPIDLAVDAAGVLEITSLALPALGSFLGKII